MRDTADVFDRLADEFVATRATAWSRLGSAGTTKNQINEWLELSPDLSIGTYGALIAEAVER